MAGRSVVDTGVLLAALLTRDDLHHDGLAIVQAAERGTIEPLAVTDFVLAETLNYLVKKAGSSTARDGLKRILASPGLVFGRISDAAFFEARDSILMTFDGLSFVDSLIVAHMRETSSRVLYSFDEGFDQVRGVRRVATVRSTGS